MIKYNQFLNEAKVKADTVHDYDAINKFELDYLQKQGFPLDKFNSLVALIKKLTKDSRIKPYVLFKDQMAEGKLDFRPERIDGTSLRTRIKIKVNSAIEELKSYSKLYKNSAIYLKFINDVDYIMTEFADKFGPPTQAREEGSARHEYSFGKDTFYCTIWLDFFIDALDAHNMVVDRLNKLRKRNDFKLTSYQQNKRSFDENTSIFITMEI